MLIEGLTANPKRVAAGGIVHLNFRTRTFAGVLTNAGTSAKIGFFDPSGDAIALSSAITPTATGTYDYAYQTVTSKEPGSYRLYVEAIHTDGTSNLITELGDPRNFEVY